MDEMNGTYQDPMLNDGAQSIPGQTDIVGFPLETIVDQEIAQMVTSRKQASEDWRKPFRLEWDEAFNNYEQIYDSTGKKDWQATTFQPMTTSTVERSVASLHNMQLGSEAPVEYKSRNTLDEQRIRDTNDIIQHDLEMCQFKVGWTDFLRNLSLYGTGIGKVDYKKEEAEVMVKIRQKPMMQMFQGMLGSMASMFGFGQPQQQDQFEKKKMLVKDYANFKNCDIYKIYPQPYTEDFSKDYWVIEEFEITNKELLDGAMKEDPYYRLDNVTPSLLMSGEQTTDADPETANRRAALMETQIPLPSMDPDRKHIGLEYWGPVPKWMLNPELRNDEIAKYQIEYAWIWVIDGQYVVRKRTTPIIDAVPPYVKGNYIRRPGEFYGIGNGKLLMGLQGEKNEIRNTRQDNINLILNKVVGILKDKIAKGESGRLTSEPGQLWPFTGIDDIRKALFTIDFPDITPDSWRASAEIDREAQEVTDVVKTTQTIGAGEDQAGNGTFRGQLLNKQQQNERFILYARILNIVGLNAAIMKIYQRIYQFKSYDQIAKILGEKRGGTFELILPEEISSLAYLIPLGDLTTQSKGIKLAQLREFYMLAANEPFLKKIETLRIMYRLMGIGSDPDEVLWSDQEFQAFNEAKRMLTDAAGVSPDQGQQPPGMPQGGPIAGNAPPPNEGLPQPAMPAAGPGASSVDGMGRPV